MASITKYVRLRDMPSVEGLCPHCWNPSLKLYYLEKFSLEGIDILGERVMCPDCRKWIGPLKEYQTIA